MIQYKWCVCDMDGTLLNSKDIISEENEAALKKLQQMGLEVIIASGRVDLLMKPFIKQLNLKGNIICCNGGLIKNIETGEILYSKVMDKGAVREIIDYALGNNINFLIYTNKVVYSNKNNPKAEKYEKLNMSLSKDLQIPITYIDDSIIKNIHNIDIFKILLVCDNHEIVKVAQKHLSKSDKLTAVSSVKGLLDIMASNTSKGHGLKILSDKLDVDLDKVIAFGDNYNDVEMFQCVGMPIAMGNAEEDVKLQAKYVTKSNDEAGIAYAINNYILQK
ncbi:Cof-type HAD-IIB family hydrolase [Clostridium magnum]|uniref:Putative phosphatase YwpJ n=1 Tax=Clostridium magnum DSM 2767 TaxID=1121326 RepID=A0A162RHN1_9CLOT|nr:Cof-type HAD-IIB family hydrolase [Clostridium magnum]KZL89914.1 putative phosphatase YwpJ [Clostridium magnum DSM 2767]SHI45476.1 hypothetical protein SAMN02745944_04328 [Clostridium magnum DSM 2767]